MIRVAARRASGRPARRVRALQVAAAAASWPARSVAAAATRVPLDRVRERLREQERRPRADEQHQLDRGDRGSRRGSPAARGGQLVRGDRTGRPRRRAFRRPRPSPRWRRRHPGPGLREAVGERRLRPASRARARRARRRATERRTSPSRAGSKAGSAPLPATSRSARCSVEHRRLDAAADVEDAAGVPGRREQRRDDVADVDEVAHLAARRRRWSSARRAPAARGRSRRRRPRAPASCRGP